MKKLLTTACLFVVTTIAIVSFIAPAVFGQEKKVDPLPDKSVTDRVDKLFAQWDKPDSPGCALGIVKDGRLIYKRGYGMANLDYDNPISSKSVFEIASMVKQFVGMSILLLAKQGKLSLDDEIQKYLPEVPRYQSPITVRHLIYHTSGIRSQYGLVEFAGMASFDLTDDDVLGLIARQKELNHKPGEEFIYTDTAYFLLGLIVKKVSGKSVHDFAVENIFKPLGMTNTNLEVDRTLAVRNRATGHRARSNGGFSVAITKPWGEMDTTVEDLFLWDQNFYNNKLGGGPDLISAQLSTGRLNNGENTRYAFGLQVDEYKGLKWIGHNGGGGGFRSNMIRFPEQKFSVMCLCNADNINPVGLANQVADIFLADQFKKGTGGVSETVDAAAAPDIISVPEKELASLTGLYVDPIRERQLRFYMEDGKLLYRAGPSVRRLSPLSQNRFKVVGVGAPFGVEMVFVRSIAGGPMQVKVIRGGETTTLDAVRSETPTSAQLAEFTGKYLSDELAGAIHTLSIKDGKLILQVRNGITVFSDRGQVLAVTQGGSKAPKDILLTPAFADAFEFVDEGRRVVRFTRNQQNAVSGFTLSTGTVRRLRFNKL